MSREMKFRAWDGEKIILQESLLWNGEKFISGLWNYEETHIIDEEFEPEIMQYTGLKDKNGKEIYEGDICLFPSENLKLVGRKNENGKNENGKNENGKNVYIYEGGQNKKRIISNLGYAFGVGTPENPKYSGILNNSTSTMASDAEVIGNIYENPDMLEEQK